MKPHNPHATLFYPKAPDSPSRGSWWLDLPRPDFYPMALKRTEELNPLWGCSPVITNAPEDATNTERFWNKKPQQERRIAS